MESNIKALQKILNNILVPKINEIFSLVNIKDEITIYVSPDYDYSVYYLSSGERVSTQLYTITFQTKKKYPYSMLLGIVGDMILSVSRYVLSGSYIIEIRYMYQGLQGTIPAANFDSSVESNPLSDNLKRLINYFKDIS